MPSCLLSLFRVLKKILFVCFEKNINNYRYRSQERLQGVFGNALSYVKIVLFSPHLLLLSNIRLLNNYKKNVFESYVNVKFVRNNLNTIIGIIILIYPLIQLF